MNASWSRRRLPLTRLVSMKNVRANVIPTKFLGADDGLGAGDVGEPLRRKPYPRAAVRLNLA